MDHLQRVEEAKLAIDRVNGDTSVDSETTRESLEEIRDEIEMLIEAFGK